MDPDVMITIVLTLEVLLFAVVAGALVARGLHRDRRGRPENNSRRVDPTEMHARSTSPATTNVKAGTRRRS